MDKNAIKKFAVWARTELIARVSLKGVEYGITEDNIEDANADSVGGKVLTVNEKKQRQALIAEINDKGYKQVMEEVAYTWFNRFSALRFMEVNGYIPSHVRVFTDEENNFKPQIITEAIHLDLDGLNMEKVYELKDAEKTEELYKYLLIVQCNALNKILPGMFQKIADYTELLLPDNLLREGSVIQQMIELISEEDWKDAVQIIGWLYEAYNTEKNELVYDGNMSKSRISKDLLPAATTIFTPDWSVRYMVENSLGRLWLEGHPDVKEQLLPTEEEQSAFVAGNCTPEDTKWHYYLEEAEQEAEVQEQLVEIRKEYAALTPDQLKVIDPCSGSGHILVYMFDVLMKIYESYGYTPREAVASIVENNLYGLDIDDRAAQLAYFAVMMKARQYDRRFFSRGIQPHVYAIVESNHVDKFAVDYFCNGDMKLTDAMDTIISELHDAKEYGSILTVTPQDWSTLYDRFAEITEDINMSRETALRELLPLVHVAEVLSSKYWVVITNPPYFGSSRFSIKLDTYVKEKYFDEKADLSVVMLKRALENFSKINGFISFITTTSWMFLSSFEKIRHFMSNNACIDTLVDFGTELFDGKVGHNPIVAWTNRNRKLNYRMTAIRLVDFCYARRDEKEREFFNKKNYYLAEHDTFSKIPGNPITYWVGEKVFWAFENCPSLKTIARARSGAKTGKNEIFIMNWWEVIYEDIGFNIKTYEDCLKDTHKWYPHNKGGNFRNWYGNRELVVRFEHGGEKIREYAQKNGNAFDINATDVFFHEGLTWTALTSYKNSFRYSPAGCVFDTNKGPMMFNTSHDILMYLLAFMVSPVAQFILKALNQSLSLQNGDVDKVPIILDKDNLKKIVGQVERIISLVKADYDESELSFDFGFRGNRGKSCKGDYENLREEKEMDFKEIKSISEELNAFFINLYDLKDVLIPDVAEKDIASCCKIPDEKQYVKSFISYAVGCMFGRYSLDVDGLAYAGGNWDASKYASFAADKDNIIPICDDEYFEDDIVGLFVEFVKTVYGAETLDENLKFIADALGGKGQPKDVIRNYFLSDFYSDHCKIYQKRPIYWLFDSGKKNGFKALIYMHRYQPDTIARIRTDYVHEQQARYRTALADLEQRIANASTGERVKLNRKLTTLQAQDTEIRTYEEKIHHLADQMISIDLDDGVKKNYAIFQDVLAKIK